MGCHFLLQCMKVKSESEVAQSCPTLSDPMDCSLPGSSVHGIFQARALEWGAIAFSEIATMVPHWISFQSKGFSRVFSNTTVQKHQFFGSQLSLGPTLTSIGEGNGTPLQYSCLQNPMDGGVWKAAVHGVAEGRTQLRDFTFTFPHIYT